MARFSKKANEPVTLWQSRIRSARRMWESRRWETRRFREAISLRFEPLLPGVGASELGLDVPHVDQVNLNLSRRYVDWLQSQATDEQPLITYPRDAEADDKVASMNETLLGRVFQEARGVEEFRDSIPAICANGCSAIWVGIHSEVVDRTELREVTKDVGQAVEDAAHGQHTPLPNQDHGVLQAGLDAAASDPLAHIQLGMDRWVGMMDAAKEHRGMMGEAADRINHVRIQRGKVWTRRLPVGTWTLWDHSVWDIKDARWMARKIVMSEKEAKEYEGFRSDMIGKVKPEPLTEDEGYQPLSTNSDGVTRGVNEADIAQDDMRVIVWECWDKVHRTRHYVSESVEHYLEKDEAYPYSDDVGNPIIPGFFPCKIVAPLLPDEERPERTFGIPLLATAWPQQEEIIKLRSFALAQAKRHAIRVYEVGPEVDEETLAQLAAGVDGTMVQRDPSTDPGKMVIPVQFHVGAADIFNQSEKILSEWAMAAGMPAADLTSQPQADTATQEQIGLQSGRQQAGDVVRQLEIAAADVMEIIRALVMGFYSDEQIADLIGARHLDSWEKWRRSSLEGDRLQVRFAARAKAESAVRVKQMMDVYSLLKTDVDPITGMQKWNSDHILSEIVRSLGAGDLRPFQLDEQQKLLMQQQQQQEMDDQQQVGEQGGSGPGDPQTGAPSEGSEIQRANATREPGPQTASQTA